MIQGLASNAPVAPIIMTVAPKPTHTSLVSSSGFSIFGHLPSKQGGFTLIIRSRFIHFTNVIYNLLRLYLSHVKHAHGLLHRASCVYS